jgi:hypothetical protein
VLLEPDSISRPHFGILILTARRKLDPLAIACPRCSALPKHQCTTRKGTNRKNPHLQRILAAQDLPQPTTPSQPATTKIPAIYISENPVSLEEWRNGKNSPKLRPARLHEE